MTKDFLHKVKIYYEDTDSGGVVYYANYLKFLERARSEIIYTLGLTNKKLLNDYNTLIIVKSCNIKYKKPAKFEDVLTINSRLILISKVSFTMEQIIKRDNETISDAEVGLVTVNNQGKPVKIPEVLLKSFEKII